MPDTWTATAQPEAEAEIQATAEPAAEAAGADTAQPTGGAFSKGDAEPAATAENSGEPGPEALGSDSYAVEAGQADADGAPPVTIPVRYNHQSRLLTLEEARTLAQKGLKYDELTPALDKLRYLAAANHISLQEMADGLAKSQDNLLYQSILGECGGNETLAKRLYEAEKSRWQTGYASARDEDAETAREDRNRLTARLADDFLELKAEFPAIREFGDLPRAVVETAVNRNISLFDAYLRFQHSEKRRAAEAEAAREAASKASAGSLAAGTEEDTDPAVDAMLAGIWSGR